MLDGALHADDIDPTHGHLVEHLLDHEPGTQVNSMWTRVFSRDDLNELVPGIYPLGPDLIYDKSMRDALSTLAVSNGEVLFSPMIFKKQDLDLDLAKSTLQTP